MARKKSFNSRLTRGFTLIELMIAITIVSMVVAIVFASFAAVANGTEEVRNAAHELRSRAFLSRNFSVNLAQITEGWLPGAQGRALEQATGAAQPVSAESFEVRYAFLGEDIDGPLGPADTFSFVTSTPLMGAQGLPGFPKYVTYEVITDEKDADDPDAFEEEEAEAILQILETPVMTADPNASSFDSAGFADTSFGDDEEPSPFSDVSWTIAIESMNVQYYDGQTLQWVDSWDSDQRGYLPWAVDIKINFPRDPNEEDDDKRDVIEEPEFRLLFSLPPGAGQKDPTPGYQPPRDPYRELLTGGPQT